MCGIAGIMTNDGSPPPAQALQAMAQAILHRGPDGEGKYLKDDTGLVQRRLAIIDLTTGDQPLFEPNGAALVANGEIYNYIELRAAMPEVEFSTQSDCEVPLHLYRRHHADFAKSLRGMYAIALHDPVTKHLYLARDQFGIKPLYYAETPRGLVFASEPQALLASGFVTPQLSAQSRDELLQLQFTTSRNTIWSGIKRVLPGETLVVTRGRIVRHRRIHALPESGLLDCDAKEAEKEFDRIWQNSVNVHQRSDVPYGMFLSGGIDSSAVLAMMARLNNRPVRAFTAGFSGTRVADERALAHKVARHFGAEHVEVEFGESDFWRLLPTVVSALDDPTADYATLPTFKLAAVAHQSGLKVILSGEGGDELFGGYGRYRRALRPWWLGGRSLRSRGTLEKTGILRGENAHWYDGMNAALRAAQKPGRTRLQVAQALDCEDWLPNDLLTKLDRCLMAHGVEGRTPFLDPEVAGFAFRLPDRLKIVNGLGKGLLRQWLAQHAPVAEPFSKKRGFTVPVAEWIGKQGARLGPLVTKQEAVKALCDTGAVEAIFRAAASDKRAGFAAWSVLFYALWHRRHIEGKTLPADVFAALE